MKLLVTLLLCSRLVWVHAEDKNVTEGDVVVKVLGHSGKINIRLKNKEFNTEDEVVVDMEEIKEVTSNGTAAGKAKKHQVNSFASQDFTFSALTDDKYEGSLDAKKLTFTSTIKSVENATLKVDLYIFKKAGDIVNGDEVTQVKKGTVKFNIELKDWKFCENSTHDCNGAGSDVDFVLSIKSKSKPEKKSSKDSSKKQAVSYNLGNAEIQLSSKVKVDGIVKAMASEYPKLAEKSKKQTFITFRFPKFDNTIVYDPAIDMTTSGANGEKIANMLNLFLVAFSIAFVRFLA